MLKHKWFLPVVSCVVVLASLVLAVAAWAQTLPGFGAEALFMEGRGFYIQSKDQSRRFGIDSSRNWTFEGGHLTPSATNTLDLGSGTYSWRAAYVKELSLGEGSNCYMGVATLTSGVATVATTACTTNSRIWLSQVCTATANVSTGVYVIDQVNGVGFSIYANEAVSGGKVNWMIVKPH